MRRGQRPGWQMRLRTCDDSVGVGGGGGGCDGDGGGGGVPMSIARVQRFTVKTVLYARFPSIMPKFVTSVEHSRETRVLSDRPELILENARSDIKQQKRTKWKVEITFGSRRTIVDAPQRFVRLESFKSIAHKMLLFSPLLFLFFLGGGGGTREKS